MITFDAHFDGEHLCPEQPVVLPQNVRLRVTVIESDRWESDDESCHHDSAANPAPTQKPRGFLEEIIGEYGLIEGPSDWSAELDHYLYGTPKRGDRPAD